MRRGITFTLSAPNCLRLEALVADRNTPQKHVCRARIVLLSADVFGPHAIMHEAGESKTAVWRWQSLRAGGGRRAPSGQDAGGAHPAAGAGGGDACCGSDATGSTRRDHALDGFPIIMVAAISVSSVQRIWRGHGLQPHWVRQYKLTTTWPSLPAGRCMYRHRHQEFIRLRRRGRGSVSNGQDRPCHSRQLCRS